MLFFYAVDESHFLSFLVFLINRAGDSKPETSGAGALRVCTVVVALLLLGPRYPYLRPSPEIPNFLNSSSFWHLDTWCTDHTAVHNASFRLVFFLVLRVSSELTPTPRQAVACRTAFPAFRSQASFWFWFLHLRVARKLFCLRVEHSWYVSSCSNSAFCAPGIAQAEVSRM